MGGNTAGPMDLSPLSATDLQEEESSALQRKLTLMGTDVAQIPCFRNSFLYGILSGFGSGVAYFAFTSNIPRATSYGFYSYVAITGGYWCHCTYKNSRDKFQYQQIQYAMRMNAAYEGTEKDIRKERPASVSDINVPDSRVPM